jgi:hypothetical protein
MHRVNNFQTVNAHRDVYTRKMSAKVRGEYIQQNLQPILPRPSPERLNVEPETTEASPSHSFQPATNNKMLSFPASSTDVESMRIKRDLSDRDDFVDDGPPTPSLRNLLNQTTYQVRILFMLRTRFLHNVCVITLIINFCTTLNFIYFI